MALLTTLVEFSRRFRGIWSQITEAELSTIVDPQRFINSIPTLLQATVTALPTGERQLYPIFDILFKLPHNLAASEDVSHFHSTIQPGAAEYQPIGDPDYIFEFEAILVGIIEVKTFWNVTTESINELIEGA
jgi:hypothetical protein